MVKPSTHELHELEKEFVAISLIMTRSSVCGVILAGGRSLRMGQDKALLEIDGRTMLARLAGQLAEVADEIVISSNDAARFPALGFPVIPDVYAGQGPLAGLHAAMGSTSRTLVLLLACDLPCIRSPLLASLIALAPGFDAVIPRTTDGAAQPLCAVYRRTCFPSIEAALVRHSNRMTGFLEESPLKVRWVSRAEGGFEDDDLINLNTPNDLDSYIKRCHAGIAPIS